MEVFLTVIHSLACIFLALVILMQSGRGGGLTEAFAAAESILGAKTNAFMVKATAVLATVFILTSLSLTFLSFKKEKSLLMSNPAAGKPLNDTERFGQPVDVPANVVTETN